MSNTDTKTVTITWEAAFNQQVEVPKDWAWDGDLSELLDLTDGMPFNHPSGDLTDYGVEL